MLQCIPTKNSAEEYLATKVLKNTFLLSKYEDPGEDKNFIERHKLRPK